MLKQKKDYHHASLETCRDGGTVEDMFDKAAALSEHIFSLVEKRTLPIHTRFVIETEKQVAGGGLCLRDGSVLSSADCAELKAAFVRVLRERFPLVNNFGVMCNIHHPKLIHMRLRTNFGSEDYFIITKANDGS